MPQDSPDVLEDNAVSSEPRPNKPIVWVLTDGKIGDDVQCLAIAALLSASFDKRITRPRAPWSWVSQYGVIDPRDRPHLPGSSIHGSPPDIAIASGRRAVAYAQALKKASGGKTKIVFLKDPRAGRGVADVIWAPAHDQLQAQNAFSTLTSPHALSSKIAERRALLSAGSDGFAGSELRPMLGVILGGGAGYTTDEAERFTATLAKAGENYQSVVITPSRRTPPEFLSVLQERLKDKKYNLWDGEGDNPYIDILAQADALIVGADSHNMMSEALATGAGVYAWRPQGLAKKLAWFVDELERKGAVRKFDGAAPAFSHEPIDATPEIAAEIKRRLGLG